MGKIKRWIPFGLWPRNWGASGPSKEIEKAHYYYDGKDLDYKLLYLKYPNENSLEHKRAKSELDYSYGEISDYQYHLDLINLDPFKDGKQKQLDIAKCNLDYNRITQKQYDILILNINHDSKDTLEYKKELLKINYQYGDIDKKEYDYSLIELEYPDKFSIEYKIAINQHEYEYGLIDQYTFEINKLDLEFNDSKDSIDYKRRYLELQLKFERISEYEYDVEMISVEYPDEDSKEHLLKSLEIEHKHGKIDTNTYEKESANILEVPWFTMLSGTVNQDEDSLIDTLAVEYDWNSYFIDYLRGYGWTGLTEEEVFFHWMQHMYEKMLDTDYDENTNMIDKRIQRNMNKNKN